MTTLQPLRPDKTMLGISLIVGSVFLMSIQEALFKKYSGNLSLWQIFTLRGILAIPLLYVVACASSKSTHLLRHALEKWVLIRSLCLTLMFVSMYAAIPFLSLSTVAAGIYTAPVFVSLLSAYVIGEKVHRRVWLAVCLGFAGVLIILQPGGDAFSPWSLLPLFGGLMYAVANVITRNKCQRYSAVALAFSLNLGLLLLGVVISIGLLAWHPALSIIELNPAIAGGWTDPGSAGWLFIAFLAVLVIIIGMGLASAYQCAAATTIATFDYCYLIFMGLWDFVLFSIEPGVTDYLGMLLIVVAGLLVMRR